MKEIVPKDRMDFLTTLLATRHLEAAKANLVYRRAKFVVIVCWAVQWAKATFVTVILSTVPRQRVWLPFGQFGRVRSFVPWLYV